MENHISTILGAIALCLGGLYILVLILLIEIERLPRKLQNRLQAHQRPTKSNSEPESDDDSNATEPDRN
ncbi:MAG: hypothetical protein OXF79_21040 [Chloroflexi bacterium]|nr:hypothetical protein [Chloroflexota bacterium]